MRPEGWCCISTKLNTQVRDALIPVGAIAFGERRSGSSQQRNGFPDERLKILNRLGELGQVMGARLAQPVMIDVAQLRELVAGMLLKRSHVARPVAKAHAGILKRGLNLYVSVLINEIRRG